MVLDASLPNTQHYKVIWSNPGKGIVPSPTPQCSSYKKGSLRVTLDCGRQLLILLEKISIHLYPFQQGVSLAD